MRNIPFAIGLAAALLATAGCATSAPPPKATPPLTADQAKSFEGGVDFVSTLDGLDGRWREDWDRDLATRVGSADIIAVVSIRTLRTDTDPQQRITHRIVARVERELIGDAPEELELAVSSDEPGFVSVHQNFTRLENGPFLVYVRKGPDGLRWHLSPGTEPVVTETESRISQLRSAPEGSQTVIVRRN